MKIVTLSAVGWRAVTDATAAFKTAIQAPDWHGSGIDAFLDTMIYHDDINGLRAPYTIQVAGLSQAPSEVQDFTKTLAAEIDDAGLHDRGTNLEVAIVLED